MKEAYIYTYVNKETKKTYIGARCAYVGSCYDDFNIKYFSSSKDKEFLKDMADGKLEGQIVLVMNDDNADKKIFEVEAKMIQAYWDKYGKENSYNHYANGKWSTAGMHINIGKHPSEETRAKMSASLKGRKLSDDTRAKMRCRHPSEETRAKISAANKGKHRSDETRIKMSKTRQGTRTGEKNPMYGKHRSDETKSKISVAKKGRHPSEETRAKLSASSKGRTPWNKGKTISEETRAKLSVANKGKHLSDETRAKLSASSKGRTPWNKGKTISEETRAKISEAKRKKNENRPKGQL